MSKLDIDRTRWATPDLEDVVALGAVGLPIVGVLGVVGPALLGLTNLAILALYVAVPCLLAPALYRYHTGTQTAVGEHDAGAHTAVGEHDTGAHTAVGEHDAGPHTAVGEHDTGAHTAVDEHDADTRTLLVSAYLLLQAATLVVLASNAVRPLGYYALVAALALVVLLQIHRCSTDGSQSTLVLAQVVALHLNVVWGVTLKYNYFIGRTDIFGHVEYVRIILENGAITSEFAGFYRSFPLWHVLGAMQQLLFGGALAPRTTLFVLSGLLYAFVPVGVFLAARAVFRDETVALTAALLTALNSTVLHNGMYAIPRSAAAFLFVVVLWTWLWDDRRSVALFAALVVAIAAYHTVSLPFVFAVLAVFYGFTRLVPHVSDALPTGRAGTGALLLALVVVVQAAYWLFFSEYLLRHIVSIAVQQSAPGQVNSGVVESPLRELANYVHYSALLVFVLLGGLVGLTRRRTSGTAKAALLSALVLAGLSFPGPHLLLSRLAESFNVLRFAQYSFPFVAMAAAYGLVALLRDARSPELSADRVKLAVLLVFVVFAFTTVSNDFVASDNPVVERQFYTNYVSESEEESMRTVAAIGAGNVSSDYVTTRYYEASTYREKSRILGVRTDRDRLYLGSERDLVVVRRGELQRRPLQLWATDEYRPGTGYLGGLRYVDRENDAWTRLEGEHRVYDSGTVTAHQRSVVPRGANATGG